MCEKMVIDLLVYRTINKQLQSKYGDGWIKRKPEDIILNHTEIKELMIKIVDSVNGVVADSVLKSLESQSSNW